jgi:hypothetical protein
MKSLGRYDTEMQMFVEVPRDLDVARLRFLRWLAERGQLEHAVAGRPGGCHGPDVQPLHRRFEPTPKAA